MPSRALLLALAGAGALAAAAPAQATIVPGRGMAGVEFGMSQQQVLDILGDPDTDFTYRSGLTTYTYKRLHLRVTFSPGPSTNDVFMLYTTGRKERTKQGVGVGTSLRTLRRRLHREHCFRNSGGHFCELGGGEGGALPATEFKFGRHNRVRSVRMIQSDL
jgi:hypothetical protein